LKNQKSSWRKSSW